MRPFELIKKLTAIQQTKIARKSIANELSNYTSLFVYILLRFSGLAKLVNQYKIRNT